MYAELRRASLHSSTRLAMAGPPPAVIDCRTLCSDQLYFQFDAGIILRHFWIPSQRKTSFLKAHTNFGND